MLSSISFWRFSRFDLILFFVEVFRSALYWVDCSTIDFRNDAVIFLELSYWRSHSSENIVRPIPPRRGGRESSFLSSFEHTIPPVIAGINSFRIISSSGLNNSLISGIVRIKYVSLLRNPFMKAEYFTLNCVSSENLSGFVHIFKEI